MDIRAKMALLKKEVKKADKVDKVNEGQDSQAGIGDSNAPLKGTGRGLEYYRDPENFVRDIEGGDGEGSGNRGGGIFNVAVKMGDSAESEEEGKPEAERRAEAGKETDTPLSEKAREKQALLSKLKAMGIGQVGFGAGAVGRRKDRETGETSEFTKNALSSQKYKSAEPLPQAADRTIGGIGEQSHVSESQENGQVEPDWQSAGNFPEFMKILNSMKRNVGKNTSSIEDRASFSTDEPETRRTDAAKTPKKKGRKKKETSLPDFIKEENDYGEVWFREVEFSLDHRHGDIFLRELLDVPSDVLAFMGQDDELNRMDLRRTVFLDTETTGLAGGTGTYAFLIGIGFVRDNTFTVRLYFMPDYAYEPAMLQHINDFMKDYDGLVTFNGKCYDFPLIKTRFLLNRLKLSNPEPMHLDLLHGSRRLWKKTHGSCKLTSLECSVLDFYREDDIPGQFIPEMYFQYLRNRRFGPMEKVLEHNVYDIVSMAALIVRMWTHLEMAQGGQVCGTDYFSMASIHEKRGEEDRALEFYEKALLEKLNPVAKVKVQQKITRIYKRRKLYDKAVKLWMDMVEETIFDISAHLELAKYHERITGDIRQALNYVDWAKEIVERKKRSGSMTVYYKEIRQLNHRRSRLLKKTGEE